MVQPIFKPASLLTEYWPLFQQASRFGPIVDLACGQGRNGLFLAAKGIPVILIDRSSERLDEASHLARQAGRVVSPQELIQITHKIDADQAEAGSLLRPLILTLRRKVDLSLGEVGSVENVRGVGYRLVMSEG